jgi:hypothetical protein
MWYPFSPMQRLARDTVLVGDNLFGFSPFETEATSTILPIEKVSMSLTQTEISSNFLFNKPSAGGSPNCMISSSETKIP